MKRLHPGHNVLGDCIVSKTFPMRAEDPPGIYLGRDSVGKPVYITYWTAIEIAQMVGYPPLEVVEQLQEDYDSLNVEHSECAANIEQFAAEHVETKYIELLEKTKGEILESQERTYRSLRDASKFGTDPSADRAAKLVGGKGSSEGARGADTGDAASKPASSAKPRANTL